MEGREKSEHLLALKVMRLTRPTLFSPIIVTCEPSDLPKNLLNDDLKNDITSVPGAETLAVGQFLLLPQSFGSIYLGETFSSYLCVHNGSTQVVNDVTVKADLQTSSQNIQLSAHQAENSSGTTAELQPEDTVDQVIHHEVKELGDHILVCEVAYTAAGVGRLSFRKFYKFQVLKPLDVKTKFYNAEELISDEVYLEAQVHNITSGPICLEKVSLESSHLFTVTALNTAADGKSVFGSVGSSGSVPSGSGRQYLYCLSPTPELRADPRLLAGAINVGKLDIVWRSNLGERGRLQTCPLQRMAPNYGDIRLLVQELPNIVYLEEPFVMVCKVVNTCDRTMELVLGLEVAPTSPTPVPNGMHRRTNSGNIMVTPAYPLPGPPPPPSSAAGDIQSLGCEHGSPVDVCFWPQPRLASAWVFHHFVAFAGAHLSRTAEHLRNTIG
ncbi:trafficking protein particle complex subunit 13 isoform X1 [Ischnura elegans]|uniref:trafficking protein particle complex subunit 13 isoform X1 n=1 Tax=Ischnura elegans TaxID=197161 RepID=UPI001ED88F89|nr:trafficking protein particle complex subunit 13 isoform X1 [Ischnura elegans]